MLLSSAVDTMVIQSAGPDHVQQLEQVKLPLGLGPGSQHGMGFAFAGLTAAILLARQGLSVHVVEKAPMIGETRLCSLRSVVCSALGTVTCQT